MRGGAPTFRCTWNSCKAWYSCKTGSIFQNLKIPLPQWMEILYLWSVQTPFGSIIKITGCTNQCLASVLTKAREVVMKYCVEHPPVLGGIGTNVQIDESEVGHKQKAGKGRPSTVMIDVWGAIDQDSGRIIIVPFWKAKKNGDGHRFGPAKAEEVLPLVTRFVKPGGWVISDTLRAYVSNLSLLGYKHIALNHSEGEFVCSSSPSVHTQTLEGAWGDLKNHIRGMHGVGNERIRLHLYEFMWRRNLRVDSKHCFHAILPLFAAEQ